MDLRRLGDRRTLRHPPPFLTQRDRANPVEICLGTRMINRSEIRGAVLRAIEQAMELSVDPSALCTDESAVLLGDGSGLDSMGFINFVVTLEEEMRRMTNRQLDLVEQINPTEAHRQPISTMGQLIDFLCTFTQA